MIKYHDERMRRVAMQLLRRGLHPRGHGQHITPSRTPIKGNGRGQRRTKACRECNRQGSLLHQMARVVRKLAGQSQGAVDQEARLVKNRWSTSVLGVAKLATSR